VNNDSVLLALQRATHATLRLLTAELGGLDLTASEINTLANLADGGARTVSALGAAVGSKPATLTGILDRLERRGLISRGARPGDRRAVLVELTGTGRRTAARVRRAVADLERRLLAGVPEEAVAGASTVLRALAEAAS
jgi:MarR family transcriptional regulator, organic hydroperoxide resistance regulator